MLVSWNWLNELVDLPLAPDTVAERLTVTGNEIERIHRPCGKLAGVVVARVTHLEPHATKGTLQVVTLNTGQDGAVQCVTAATNVTVGDLVPYGPPGSVLADGMVLSVRDFDGIASPGMMLSARELGVPDAAIEEGILILPDDLSPGQDVVRALGLDDLLLELSITPNRGDMLSMRGVVREVAALFPETIVREKPRVQLDGAPSWSRPFGGVTLEDDGCLLYTMGMVRDVVVAPSPLSVRIRLALCGVRPVNNVVDATNLTMLALGQPLHGFDMDRLPGSSISVRAAREGELFLTLDHKERTLQSSDLVICSGDEIVALAGVMGGLNSEIHDGTTTVLLESASFDAPRVGGTSRHLGLASEASYRFARGVDPSLPEEALSYAVECLRSWGCGVPEVGAVVATRGLPRPVTATLTEKKLRRIVGWADMDKATSLLVSLGLVPLDDDGVVRRFVIPSFRPDMAIEEDLIEEVARIRGYDHITPKIPGCTHGSGGLDPVTSAVRELRVHAIARGYTEVVSYSFHSPRYAELLRLTDDPRGDFLSLTNPLSAQNSVMRSTMLPGLMEALERTVRSGWRGAVRLFEIGRIFPVVQEKLVERDRVAGLVFVGKDRRNPYGEAFLDDLLSVKSDIQSLALGRGISLEFVQGEEPFGHLGQTAHIVYDGAVVGFLVRLKPEIQEKMGLDGPIYCFEFDLAPLVPQPERSFIQGSAYPGVFRDVSLLIDESTPVTLVIEHIRSVAGDLLASVYLFDIYRGDGVPEGQRSVAFSLTYRRNDRTLQDVEVDQIHGQVRSRLEGMGYTLR